MEKYFHYLRKNELYLKVYSITTLAYNILVFGSSFNAYDFSQVIRETNYVSHSLACFALVSQTCGFVTGGLPDAKIILPALKDVSLNH